MVIDANNKKKALLEKVSRAFFIEKRLYREGDYISKKEYIQLYIN